MIKKCFQLYLCDDKGSYASMCPTNASPIFLDTPKGRRCLWLYARNEQFSGGLDIDEADFDLVRDFILYDDPLRANPFLIGAFIIEWEII